MPKAKGGRGKRGGLSAYAKRIGKSKGYVTQIRNAAEVLESAKPFAQVNGFLDKAKHLAAIHKLPKVRHRPRDADVSDASSCEANTDAVDARRGGAREPLCVLTPGFDPDPGHRPRGRPR